MADKERLCPTCGSYIPEGAGVKITDDEEVYLIHKRCLEPYSDSDEYIVEGE